LGPLREVATEAVDLLVVDLDGLVGAERTDLPATSGAVEVVALSGSNGGQRVRISLSERELVDLGVVEATARATGRRAGDCAGRCGCPRACPLRGLALVVTVDRLCADLHA